MLRYMCVCTLSMHACVCEYMYIDMRVYQFILPNLWKATMLDTKSM